MRTLNIYSDPNIDKLIDFRYTYRLFMATIEAIGRRQFLRLGLGILTASTFTEEAVTTPQPIPQKEPVLILSPGWIEAPVTTSFIQKEKGHFNHIREAIFKGPLLKEISTDFFSYLM